MATALGTAKKPQISSTLNSYTGVDQANRRENRPGRADVGAPAASGAGILPSPQDLERQTRPTSQNQVQQQRQHVGRMAAGKAPEQAEVVMVHAHRRKLQERRGQQEEKRHPKELPDPRFSIRKHETLSQNQCNRERDIRRSIQDARHPTTRGRTPRPRYRNPSKGT